MNRLVLFRDFVEDNRLSLDLYADYLYSGITQQTAWPLQVSEVQPKIAGLAKYLPDRMQLKMRWSRYLGYPRQARGKGGDINHIIEIGYAHLVRVLDPKKTVVTLHSTLPLVTWNNPQSRWSYSHRPRLLEYSIRHLKRVARIISVSETLKRELLQYSDCREEQITVIPFGLDDSFQPLDNQPQLRRRLGLPLDVQLVLITGWQGYKNHLTSLKVCQRLQSHYRQPIQLVRVGALTPEWQSYRQQLALQNEVIEIPYLPISEMPLLYNAVDLLLFPSWVEGFGRPPLEAMACDTPVVTSDIPAIREVAGDAVLMAPAEDSEGLARHAYTLLTDRQVREQMIAKGKLRAKRFNWAENIKSTLKVYQELLESN